MTYSAGDQRAGKLIEAGMALSSDLSLAGVLQRIVELAADVCDARYGALGVLNATGDGIEEFITTGISPEEIAAMAHPPVGEGLLGILIHERTALRIPAISEDPRSAGFPEGHPPMHSFLGAPVAARGAVFGNIYLTDKIDAPEFTAEDEEAVLILATQAGLAIENARLYEEALEARRDRERLAVMADRERISRELHDGAIQSLFAVGMGLQGVTQGDLGESARPQLQRAVDEIDRVIRDLRNYIFGLRPGILADRQLAEAIEALAVELQERTGVVTIVEVDADVAAALAAWAGELVQLVREALSNVGRHASATTCRVSLLSTASDEYAELVIDDDGAGMSEAAGTEGGHGLPNMQARVERLGGTFSVTTSPDEGTTISVTVPLRG